MTLKRACLVYVPATESILANARQRLEAAGYSVCEVLAAPAEADMAKAGDTGLPEDLRACLDGCEIAVFLLPAQSGDDCMIGAAATEAVALTRPIIGLYMGERSNFPEAIDDAARSVIPCESDSLDAALSGEELWERPGGVLVKDREIRHVKCQ